MILSALSGTLTGLLGSLVTNVFNLFNQKQNNKHEIDLINARIKEKQAEAAANIQEVTLQSNIAKDKSDSEIYSLSQKYGNQTAAPTQLLEKLFDNKWTMWIGTFLVFLLGVIDVVRAGIRPGVTIVLMYITGYLVYQNFQFMQKNSDLLSIAQVDMIIESIIYMTFSVISWWFGDRRMAKFADRLNDGNKRH